jgi:FAD:protein FMN transferase
VPGRVRPDRRPGGRRDPWPQFGRHLGVVHRFVVGLQSGQHPVLVVAVVLVSGFLAILVILELRQPPEHHHQAAGCCFGWIMSGSPSVDVVHRRIWGSSLTLGVAAAAAIGQAEVLLFDFLGAVEAAASRFRDDAEIHRIEQAGGSAVEVSPLLFEMVHTACSIAEMTGGAVDPTVGQAIVDLGYDRDIALVRSENGPPLEMPKPAPGWWNVDCNQADRSVRIPAGVKLDLGATAKAFAADRAAELLASHFGCGVLVSIGGDLRVAGEAHEGGWPIGLDLDSSTPPDATNPAVTVSIEQGALASSSPELRKWRRGDRSVHHIVDPLTGDCAPDTWLLATTAADHCVDANGWSTAAIVWGPEAPDRLTGAHVPSRLVSRSGEVIALCGWPLDGDRSIEQSRVGS